ncbi:hypothetical protein E1162_15765 [Rhodobacteraceae bacterium RKSG542]|uniref:hypothetical protein n=1 Tax=Pseudovibrio flavus TaxID=2529854 RepID=UPI0012BD7118|nr:hypothetical protein [Pseudovibrio flavus]MTI18702.1 hypothetical protein [Pseudovibrio flavus]
MMTKQEEFLWIVQTAILSNSISLAANSDTSHAKKYSYVYSERGVRIVMREAVRASRIIPSTMDAADAADEFNVYMLKNLRDILDSDSSLKECPSWFAR